MQARREDATMPRPSSLPRAAFSWSLALFLPEKAASCSREVMLSPVCGLPALAGLGRSHRSGGHYAAQRAPRAGGHQVNAQGLASSGIGGPDQSLYGTLQRFGTGQQTTQGPHADRSNALTSQRCRVRTPSLASRAEAAGRADPSAGVSVALVRTGTCWCPTL
jgi:hypothetical protein